MKQAFINQMEPWIGKEERKAMNTYLKSGGWLTEFKETQRFEGMIASYTGTKYACAVNNGTVSLYIALLSLGIGKGDEVIVPDLTMIASANTILLSGATPRLVDINPATLCLDVALAEKAISKRTKAIMLVNFNGRSPNMHEITKLCKKYQLFLIEDAAQALGSFWNKKHMGTFGDIGSFSFSTPKIITTGQGGALVTNNDALIEKIKKIKDFGRIKSGIDLHETLGFNFKFTDIQAVIGIEQMKKLKTRVKRKKEIFSLYEKGLSGIKEIRFIKTDLAQVTPWFIDVLVENREELMAYLRQQGIGSRPFYPPVHTQAPYRDMKPYKNLNLPMSQETSAAGLWLPSSLFLSDKQIESITSLIKNFYKK